MISDEERERIRQALEEANRQLAESVTEFMESVRRALEPVAGQFNRAAADLAKALDHQRATRP